MTTTPAPANPGTPSAHPAAHPSAHPAALTAEHPSANPLAPPATPLAAHGPAPAPGHPAADTHPSALMAAARAAREHAHAPYSRFRVGAAVRCRDGRVFSGCNVENASYGLCNCAERTALFTAVAAGARAGDIAALAVVGDTPEPISPCGACRQVMLELGGAAMAVELGNLAGATRHTTAGELLPFGFGAADLGG